MFEFRVFVKDLNCKEGTAQWRTKGGTDTARHTGQQQYPPVGRGQPQFSGDKRTEASADLCNRALSAG